MPDSAKYQVDSRSLLLAIGEGITRINWRSDATVYSQGDEADALFYIQAGRLKITAVSTFGKEAVVAILGTGDFFGEGCMAGQPLRLSSAKTLVKSSIWRLDKAALVRALRTQLANFGKEGQPLPIIAPISQKILAEMIGTTRRKSSMISNGSLVGNIAIGVGDGGIVHGKQPRAATDRGN